MRKVLIIGATSAIAQATAQLLAASGDSFVLVARDPHKLAALADDLTVRGASNVETAELSALDFGRHEAVIARAAAALDGLDVALIAHGSLPDQNACEASFELTLKELEVNAISIISLLTHLANYFVKNKSGTIAVISSVAGDRGRQSNYVYGTAKGAVSIFLQGLRNRMCKSGVHVLTIKPGFVDTPMTEDFEKGLLWATPDTIAKDIVRAIRKKADTIYTPWFWRPIMVTIKLIPERIFKRLGL